ncbi:MAG: hypothetical protein GY750_08895 [Lentisphaerae bacterium]|nr:hypothetical protein [Lentisphaerota bacterium]MCP4101527.1 hypothetical protein [Lentisphaerota bacterium]
MKKTALMMAAAMGIAATLGVKAATQDAKAFPDHVYAPTVNVATQKNFDFEQVTEKTGVKYYKLSGITVLPNGCNGYNPLISLDGKNLMDKISAIRNSGGDVIFGFDDNDCISTDESAYQKAIDAYNIKWIDFKLDISALPMFGDCDYVDSMNKVIKKLQENNPNLIISYTTTINCTLPLNLGYFNEFLGRIISNALDNHVNVNYINVQCMLFTPPAEKRCKEDQDHYLQNVMERAIRILQIAYERHDITRTKAEFYKMISLTPVLNDQSTLSTQEAQEVVDALSQNDSKLLSLVFENTDDFNTYTEIFKSFTK